MSMRHGLLTSRSIPHRKEAKTEVGGFFSWLIQLRAQTFLLKSVLLFLVDLVEVVVGTELV
jgi:hypothetical protein